MADATHVVPINDLIEHDSDTNALSCICQPELELVPCDDGTTAALIVHHSLDGRELEETFNP